MPPAIMAHSYAQNHIHLVFSTKNREKLFTPKFLPCLWAYTAAICKNQDLLTFAAGDNVWERWERIFPDRKDTVRFP